MEIENYISSYNRNHFIEAVNKKDAYGIKNENYVWDSFTRWAKASDLTVEQFREPFVQNKKILKEFNNDLLNFVIHITYLYRKVGIYELGNPAGKTAVLIGHDKVLEALSNIKFSSEIIDDFILKGKDSDAILYRKYCIKKFNEILESIENVLSIRINESPLRQHVEDVVKILEKCIDFKELEIIRELNMITNEEPQQPETITKQQNEKIKAPVLTFFCSLINEIGIDKKEETESAINYCKRICANYNLPYTDRVRQNFYGSETKNIRREFTEKILPFLDTEIKRQIQKHLDTKYPPMQNMYT